jgi:ATP-dependent helicase HrpA
MSVLVQLEVQLDETLLVDRHRLRRRLRELRDAERQGRPFDQNLERFRADLDKSVAAYRLRRASRPAVTYDESLPIYAMREEILAALETHQVLVVAGETGSGKSTQLPKLCLELGRGLSGLIGHTQPRRIAARTIASRIADELHVQLGREVGYQVRFTDATSPQTCIKLMTDGLLLAETQSDRWLNRYDTLIIDEAHERSLNIDFLIGYLHRLLPKRLELKVIITSATIDAERFAGHFRSAVGEVPVIEVSGRMYPVEVVYWGEEQVGSRKSEVRNKSEDGTASSVLLQTSEFRLPTSKPTREDVDPAEQLADAVEFVCQRGAGDVLVFLPTERDIHETMKTLKGRNLGGVKPDLLPLYARLSVKEQQRVFESGGGPRRIILATNVAESSLTVPGIRYVIDTGTARISRYSPKSKLQRLPIEAVSRASADQRAGRCGRIGPGVCVRLYDREDYEQRERYTPPEILRSNLAAVILQLESLGLGHVADYPFLDPPKQESVQDGYKTLFEIGAVDAERKLTPLGRILHRLPVDPRIARIIVAGEREGWLDEILIIAAALEVQDPRERPLEKQQLADEAHSRFADPDSDFLGYLRLWDFYHKLKDDLTRGQLRKACQQNFLSFLRMKEWIDVHRELVELVRTSGIVGGKREGKSVRTVAVIHDWTKPFDPSRFAGIHRALLTGFLSGLAMRTESGEYLAAGNAKTALWPGSGLTGKSSKWLVTAEQVETSRRFLRTCARIDPVWIEPLAEHLVQRSHSEPHWDQDALAVMAVEKVVLFGLPIVPRRRVRYAKLDAVVSRQLFLRDGLVNGLWPEPPEFLAKNLERARHLADLQTRARQPALLRDEAELVEFYDHRIPPEICDGQRLVHWYRSERRTQQHLLEMTDDDLLVPQAQLSSPDQFPEQLAIRHLELPLAYKHEPGRDDDGVTVTVPHAGLNQLLPERLGWLVPGMLEEKVTALLKSLPKDLRRELVPLPDMARKVTAVLRFGDGPLAHAVAQAVQSVAGVTIPSTAFQEERLPDHLRMRLAIVDQKGELLATGRNLAELRRDLGSAAATTFSESPDPRWNQDGLNSWSFEPLSESVVIERAGVQLTGYPTLLDRGDGVSLRLLDSRQQAEHEFPRGLRRLFALAVPRELKQQVDHLPHLNQWVLLSKTMPQPLPLREQLADLIAERAFLSESPWPRTQGDFGVRVAAGKSQLPQAAAEVVRTLLPLFDAYTQVRRLWERTNLPQYAATRQDVHDQLAQLLSPGFLVATPWNWLVHLPRYLKAIVRRLEKLTAGGGPRDQQQLPVLLPLWSRWKDRNRQLTDRGLYDPELEAYRWMLEEYRVMVFAQELGTAVSVSEKRLDRQWAQVTKS